VDSISDNIDRRDHERFKSSARVQYFFKKRSLRYMDCELIDVSRSGIAIQVAVSEEVFFGMDVMLEITLPGSLDLVTVSGTIKWSQSTETGLVGIRFDDLLTPEVLTRLISA